MGDVIAALQNTSVPTILVFGGLVFLFLAVVGQFVGQITVPRERQVWAGLIGFLLLFSGVALHVMPVSSTVPTPTIMAAVAPNTPTLIPAPSTGTPILPTGTPVPTLINTSKPTDTPQLPTTTPTPTPTNMPRPTPTPTVTSLPTFPVRIRTAGDNCLDVPDGISEDGVLVQLYKCHSGKNQLWTLTSNGEIRDLGGNKCLEIRDSHARNGSLVQLYECNGNTNQQWIFTPSDEIRILGDKCLEARLGGWKDVETTSRLFGTPVELYQCNGGDNQKWSLVRP
jgi:hypothetical protein